VSLSEVFYAGFDHALEKIGSDAEFRRELRRDIQETKREDPPSRLRTGLGNAAGFGLLLGGGALAGGAIGRGISRMRHGPDAQFKNSVFKLPAIIGGVSALTGGAMGASQDPKEVKREKLKFLNEMLHYSKNASDHSAVNELEKRYDRMQASGPSGRLGNAGMGALAGGVVGGGAGLLGGLPARLFDGLARKAMRSKSGAPLPYAAYPAGGAGIGALVGAVGMGVQDPKTVHQDNLKFLREKILRTQMEQG